jgi:exopolysaccharide biosynthesis polyprenyl glycosylphosphotransferase
MSEHVSRITAPWTRAAGFGGWEITRPTIPAGWANPIIALLAVVAIVGAVVVNPAAHPLLVSAVAAVAAAAMTVVRRLEDAAERMIVVLGEDHPAARVAQVVRTRRPAFAFAEVGPARVRRAATWDEAARLVASSAGAELVFAGSAYAPAVRLLDGSGRPAAIVTGVEAIQSRLGLVPLDLVGQDRWFRQLGAVRPLDAVHAAAKRGVDIAAAVVLGLLVLPLIPLVALAIRLESPGSVLYSQTRVGLGGRHFRIFKFRSMRQDAERDGARWAQAGDSRVTKVGRVMRLTRIDELPQLWNVLKGEMTLVGPRPERPEFTATLEQEIPHYGKRLAVKPGLTGWAQVRFRYTSSVEDTARKLEYDLYYLKHASLLLDLRILVATIGVVLRKAGC